MYGSSLHIVTRNPRHLRSRPSEEAVRPFPSELETPPVTKMNLLTPPLGRRASPRLIGAPNHDNRTPPDLSRTLAAPGLSTQKAGPHPGGRADPRLHWHCRSNSWDFLTLGAHPLRPPGRQRKRSRNSPNLNSDADARGTGAAEITSRLADRGPPSGPVPAGGPGRR